MRPRSLVADCIDPDRYLQELGRFLFELADWTWWVTLTFDGEITEYAAGIAFRTWARMIARDIVRDHVVVAWAWELQWRGLPAFHALLSIPTAATGFSAPVANACWKASHRSAGFTRIELYDPARGAAWYEAALELWDVNVACPRMPSCRRRRGCIWAPGPW